MPSKQITCCSSWH